MRTIIKVEKIGKNSRLSIVKHEMTAVKRVIQQNFLQKWMELEKNIGILQFRSVFDKEKPYINKKKMIG